jgi:serine/threonine protein kinase
MIRGLRNAIDKKYKVIEMIGRGSYGCVSKAKEISTGRIVALKVMKNQTLTEYELIKLLREI